MAKRVYNRLIGQDVPDEPSTAPGIDEPGVGVPDEQNARAKSTLRNLKSLGQTNIPEMPSDLHCIIIIGQIEGHIVLPPHNKTTRYEHIIPQLVAVEQNPKIKGLLIILNTVGGDVEAGLAIAEIIASMTKPTVSLVLGGGHSIGVPIAVASNYSFISETATMTIHPIRLTGLVIGVPQTYEYLDKMQDRVVKFVVKHAKISSEKFRELMFRTGELARDIGTVIVGKDAVDAGLIDNIGGISDAIKKLYQLIDKNEKSKRQKKAENAKSTVAKRKDDKLEE